MASKRILLVDDNAALREILRVYLTDAGYAVVEAGDGEAAFVLINTEKPDALVLDVVLPKHSGLDVLEWVRGSSRTPVILISSLAESEVAWKALGAAGFMRKPLHPKRLLERVAALVDGASAA